MIRFWPNTILAYFYRHERGARIYDGADEVHKMSVAKKMLRAHQEVGYRKALNI